MGGDRCLISHYSEGFLNFYFCGIGCATLSFLVFQFLNIYFFLNLIIYIHLQTKCTALTSVLHPWVGRENQKNALKAFYTCRCWPHLCASIAFRHIKTKETNAPFCCYVIFLVSRKKNDLVFFPIVAIHARLWPSLPGSVWYGKQA